MGVYIKGMEMPKEGSWTTVRIYPDGTCAVPNWQGDCTLIKGTKAVPVPPHGRLGDLYALKERITKRLYSSNHGSMAEAYYAALIDLIDTAPTIIPAEEGE